MKKRYPHKDKVLLVNITRLGDMLQATPTIRGMKMENPQCHVTVLVEKQFEDICFTIPDIDDVVALDLGMTVRSLAREQDGIIDAYEYIDEVVEDLRKRQFDYVLNMSSSAYTALLLRLIGVPRQGGWSSDSEGHRVIESEWARLFATSVFHQNRQFNSLNLVDIFRCSADVEVHPPSLVMKVSPENKEKMRRFIADQHFTNTGPLVAVQAGASQQKRQWAPDRFARFVQILTREHDARVIMTGSSKELSIIEPIVQACDADNVKIAAGKTSIPELGALISECNVMVTGDTGPMHVAVAAGTPVVSMFLASAFGFETGPYGEGHLVLQPVIGCGPCNPNKPCARPDCHDSIAPELLAKLTAMRCRGDVTELPPDFADPRQVLIYRSEFDRNGFLDLRVLNGGSLPPSRELLFRNAYRKMWLDDLGDLRDAPGAGMSNGSSAGPRGRSSLAVLDSAVSGIPEIVRAAEKGERLIRDLTELIKNTNAPAAALGRVSESLTELDREIEQLGYFIEPLAPLTRMFVFAKENLSGTDALDLASQMERVYGDLKRRSLKLEAYLGES